MRVNFLKATFMTPAVNFLRRLFWLAVCRIGSGYIFAHVAILHVFKASLESDHRILMQRARHLKARLDGL